MATESKIDELYGSQAEEVEEITADKPRDSRDASRDPKRISRWFNALVTGCIVAGVLALAAKENIKKNIPDMEDTRNRMWRLFVTGKELSASEESYLLTILTRDLSKPSMIFKDNVSCFLWIPESDETEEEQMRKFVEFVEGELNAEEPEFVRTEPTFSIKRTPDGRKFFEARVEVDTSRAILNGKVIHVPDRSGAR